MAASDNEGFRPEYQFLRICPTCFHLFEEGRPDGEEQRCRCRPRDERKWERHDFNERASLCQCCGLVPLRSGSRWSPYFCRECQILAMGVSAWERRLIFPIGRHSLMHVWVPDTLPPSLTAHGDDPAALAADVYQTLRLMNSGFEALNGWYRFIVLWRLRRLGLRETVTLEDYWNAVRRDDLNVLSVKVDAFAGLSLYARTGRLDLDEDDEVDEYRQGS